MAGQGAADDMKAFAIVKQIYEIRKDLTPVEHLLGYNRICRLASDIMARERKKDDQIAAVRRSIERQGACTVEEVCGDTRLPVESVRECLREMEITLPD